MLGTEALLEVVVVVVNRKLEQTLHLLLVAKGEMVNLILSLGLPFFTLEAAVAVISAGRI
jgi:hypothetical protein